jgi:hypothetical protein
VHARPRPSEVVADVDYVDPGHVGRTR